MLEKTVENLVKFVKNLSGILIQRTRISHYYAINLQ